MAAAGMAGLAYAGDQAQTFDVNVAFHCSYAVARDEAPPAEILLLGNSQAGAAIDPVHLGRLLDPSDPVRVEKMAIVRSDIVSLRMLVDEYVAKRGVPKLVLFQPIFQRSTVSGAPRGIPVHSRDHLGFQSWENLISIRETAVANPTESFMPEWARKGYRNTAQLWVDRQVERIIASLSVIRVAATKRFCRSDERFRIAGNWPYDTVPLAPGDYTGPVLNAEARRDWRRKMADRQALRAESPDLRFELDQNLKAIAAIEVRGGTVTLISYPSEGRAARDAAEIASYRKAFRRDVIDMRSVLTDSAQEQLEQSYRDPVHVNFEGTEILTEQLARELKGRVK